MTVPLAEEVQAVPDQHGLRIGTVVSPGDPPTVSLQGGEPFPVGVLDGTFLEPGVPVALIRQGATWLAIGIPLGYRAPAVPNALPFNQFGLPGATTTTSASYGAISGLPTLSFVKYRATTRLAFALNGTASGSVNTLGIHWGMRVTHPDTGFSDDFDCAALQPNNHLLNNRETWGGIGVGEGIPAGPLEIVGVWRRSTGAGTANMDGSDVWSCLITEVP